MRNPNARIPDFDRIVTSSGSLTEFIYLPGIDKNGLPCIKVNGYRDIKAEINSHAAECDMSLIVARLNAGDDSVIHVNNPLYGDFTNLPNSPAEALQMVMDGQRAFDALSPDIRARFGNSFERWFSSAGTADWLSAMADNQPATVVSESSESEVTT